MKARSIVISVVTCFVALTWCFAQDAMMGTWKLNEAKSKIGAGSQKNNTVVIEAAGESVKVTMDGVDPTGKPTHNEWTGKFDGKEYPVTGDANSDTRSYKKIDDRTLEVSAKKGGKVMVSGRVALARSTKRLRFTTRNKLFQSCLRQKSPSASATRGGVFCFGKLIRASQPAPPKWF
jgi:hypothetical protein